MNENEIKILTRDNRIITLQEFFEEDEKTHKEQAKLSFEEKIRILRFLQKIAYSWGNKKDVIIWRDV
jgi:hypothetical protein